MPVGMALALVAFGSVFALAFWGDFRKAQRNRYYVRADGVLLNHWVETSRDMDYRTNYSPMVRYEYVAQGRRYKSDVISHPARAKRSQGEADELLAGFASQAKLLVWYDPIYPRNSCLIKTSTLQASVPVVFGVAMLVAGVLGLILGA